MTGRILDFSIQTNSGVISGDDGLRYTFTGDAWMESARAPMRGAFVDFEADGSEARGIYLARAVPMGGKTKDKTVAGILAILLGGLGIHKFYLGFTGPGVILLLASILTCGIGLIITGVIGLIEGIIYLTKTDEEFEEMYVVNRKQWF